jgi:hypothetical protein
MLGGVNDFYTRPIPRLGIPALKMSDGPMGVHDPGCGGGFFGSCARAPMLAENKTPAQHFNASRRNRGRTWLIIAGRP